jgi:hypothetical protein
MLPLGSPSVHRSFHSSCVLIDVRTGISFPRFSPSCGSLWSSSGCRSRFCISRFFKRLRTIATCLLADCSPHPKLKLVTESIGWLASGPHKNRDLKIDFYSFIPSSSPRPPTTTFHTGVRDDEQTMAIMTVRPTEPPLWARRPDAERFTPPRRQGN